MLTTKTEDLSLILGTHKVEGENQFLPVVLRSPHSCHDVHVYINVVTMLGVQVHAFNLSTQDIEAGGSL